MKTNHQRNFKDTRDSRSVYNNYVVFECLVKMKLSDRTVAAGVTCGDHTNGKRGIAKDRRGAKKYIRSRTRFHENAATKKLMEQNITENKCKCGAPAEALHHCPFFNSFKELCNCCEKCQKQCWEDG